jgi:hypothetical protein
MIEQNSTFWAEGVLDGRRQTFITPGLVIGSFSIKDRLRFAIGISEKVEITKFHRYDHRWLLLFQFPF